MLNARTPRWGIAEIELLRGQIDIDRNVEERTHRNSWKHRLDRNEGLAKKECQRLGTRKVSIVRMEFPLTTLMPMGRRAPSF